MTVFAIRGGSDAVTQARGEGVSPLRVAGIPSTGSGQALPAIRGRDALDTKEQGQDALATRPRNNGHAPSEGSGPCYPARADIIRVYPYPMEAI